MLTLQSSLHISTPTHLSSLFIPPKQTSQSQINKSKEEEEEETGYFPSSLYTNIEEFLDNEQLYLCSPSPVLTCITLKPSFGIKRLFSLTLTSKNSSEYSEESEEYFEKQAFPSFLARRTASMEVIGNAKSKMKVSNRPLLNLEACRPKSSVNIKFLS